MKQVRLFQFSVEEHDVLRLLCKEFVIVNAYMKKEDLKSAT